MESYEIRAAEGEVKKAQENIWLLAAQIFQKLTLNLVSIREVLIRRVQSESYEILIQKLIAENSSLGDEIGRLIPRV